MAEKMASRVERAVWEARQTGLVPAACVLGREQWLQAVAEHEQELSTVYMADACSAPLRQHVGCVLVGEGITGPLILTREVQARLEHSGGLQIVSTC